ADRLGQPRPEQDRVGDDEGAADAEADGDVAELGRGVAAENQSPGGMEGPGGAHGGLRGGRGTGRRPGPLSPPRDGRSTAALECTGGIAMNDARAAKRPFDFKVAIPRLRKAVRPYPK